MSVSPASYLPKTQDQNAQAYADLMPINKYLWIMFQQSDSKARKFLDALALEMGRYQSLVYQVASEYIPNFTNSFIEYWEEMLGIPDDCFTNTGTDEERRRNIIIKLAYMNLQTEADYIALAELLGLEIQITYGDIVDTFTYTFPITFVDSDDLKYIWFINISNVNTDAFTYTFPITFGQSAADLFQCICLKQKPANTQLIFTFDPIEYVDLLGDFYVDGDGNFYIAGSGQVS